MPDLGGEDGDERGRVDSPLEASVRVSEGKSVDGVVMVEGSDRVFDERDLELPDGIAVVVRWRVSRPSVLRRLRDPITTDVGCAGGC
jgi:hypothetical protein